MPQCNPQSPIADPQCLWSMYIELHTSSAFSFLDGASLPATLIERAADLDYPALALLDRDGLYGAPQFYRAAKAAGIKAIVGAELTIGDPSLSPSPRPHAGSHARAATARVAWSLRPSLRLDASVLVSSAEGYRQLCRIITRAKLRSPEGRVALTLEDSGRADERADRARRTRSASRRATRRRRIRSIGWSEFSDGSRSGSSCSVISAGRRRPTSNR